MSEGGILSFARASSSQSRVAIASMPATWSGVTAPTRRQYDPCSGSIAIALGPPTCTIRGWP